MRILALTACLLLLPAWAADKKPELPAPPSPALLKEFERKRDEAMAASAKDLGALALDARAKGAPGVATTAEDLAKLLGTEPGTTGEEGAPADEKAEKAFAVKLAAARAKALDRFVKLHGWCGTKGLWKAQIPLAAPLAALGVEDPKTRKALGMAECPAVGWCWVVKTPHYEIFTNLAPDTQLEVAEAAEDTYEAFVAFFKPYAKLMTPPARLVMYYFETRQQLLDCCKAMNKDVGFGYGVYLPSDGKCYFRKDLDLFGLCGVIYHEGTHQLHDKLLGKMNGTPAWVTEGLASYFESLIRKDGKLVLGSDGRELIWHMTGAQYIPLEGFVNAGQGDWPGLPKTYNLPNLNPQYGQCAMLFRYFIEAEDGKLKDRFLKEILLKSCGNAKDLEKALGIKATDLVPQYVEFANRYFKNPVSATP